jgi:uncharacterized protein
MPEYLAPAVFVEETSFRSKSIEGASTSTAAFVGLTSRGPETTLAGNAPALLTRFSDFERIYGGFERLRFSTGPITNHVAHAARAFFDNGGGRLYVARIIAPGAAAAGSEALHEALGIPAQGTSTVSFKGRSMGGALMADSDTANMRVTMRLMEQGTTPAAARKQPRGTVLRVAEAADKQSYFVADGGGFTRIEGTADFPAENADAAMAILTLAVTVEDASGQVVEYQGLGLHPAHPRSAQAVLGESPPIASDALSNPVKLVVTDGAPLTLINHFLAGRAELASGNRSALVAAVTAAEGALKTAKDAAATPATTSQTNAIKTAQDALDAARKPLALFDRRAAIYKDPLQPVVRLVLTGGLDGNGLPSNKAYGDVLEKLRALEDISIIASPGSGSFGDTHCQMVNNALVTAAEQARAYRIAVLDTPEGKQPEDVRALKSKIDSHHAALYYPWIIAANPLAGTDGQSSEVALPPSGFVCGVYARTDVNRGVWKAPANETVQNVLRLQRDIGHGEQEVLNPLGVNCLRLMPNRGFRIWGARTATSDPEWKYVNIRRYFLYLEASIDRGMQWAVFEPNGERLWANVRDTVYDFLYNEWIGGALLGTSPKEAFFVRCDRSTMTQNDLDNGRLVCLVGVAAIKPAEFVIFRIGQKTVDSKR